MEKNQTMNGNGQNGGTNEASGTGVKKRRRQSESVGKIRLPNVRARRFVQNLVAGQNMKQAALAAGYTESMADKACVKILPASIAEFRAVLERKVPIGKIADTIAAGLDAMETKIATDKGVISDTQDFISFSERRQYAELAAKLQGYLATKVEHTGPGGGPIQVENLTDEQLDTEIRKLLGQTGVGAALGGEGSAA